MARNFTIYNRHKFIKWQHGVGYYSDHLLFSPSLKEGFPTLTEKVAKHATPALGREWQQFISYGSSNPLRGHCIHGGSPGGQVNTRGLREAGFVATWGRVSPGPRGRMWLAWWKSFMGWQGTIIFWHVKGALFCPKFWRKNKDVHYTCVVPEIPCICSCVL